MLQCKICREYLLTLYLEHSVVCSVRKWYRYKQLVKVSRGSSGPWTPRWQHVLCCLVTQCRSKHCQSMQ
jgi:hypothetical protein